MIARSIARGLTVVFAATAALAVLPGCSERPQAGATARKSDVRPHEGANAAFAAPGWKAGDAQSWEQQMRTRAQAQNEYSRSAQR